MAAATAARSIHSHSCLQSDETRQALSAAQSWTQTKAQLWQSENGVGSGDARGADHGQLAAAAQRHAVHRGHNRLRAGLQTVEDGLRQRGKKASGGDEQQERSGGKVSDCTMATTAELGASTAAAVAGQSLFVSTDISLSHERGHVSEGGRRVHLHAVHILDVGAG